VNLHLDVGGLRVDGFHDLVSLFQAVSLYDEIRIMVGGQGLSLTGEFGFPASQNIITRAARSFLDATGLAVGIRIDVVKSIPMAAGLGGGSSDAAATLRCLSALLAPDMPAPRLRSLAATLGSDVPFFLGSAAALVGGRGDVVTGLPPRTDYAMAAVLPGIPVGTAAAYAALDATSRPPGGRLSSAELVKRYAERPASEWWFTNSFDRVVLQEHPVLSASREALLAAGAASAGLTGSGSTVIGLFDEESAAAGCVSALTAAGYAAILLLPLATIPRVC
jgi:4-diphosphocytidyl-2-C-methyl-D-erythritol kinase